MKSVFRKKLLEWENKFFVKERLLY